MARKFDKSDFFNTRLKFDRSFKPISTAFLPFWFTFDEPNSFGRQIGRVAVYRFATPPGFKVAFTEN